MAGEIANSMPRPWAITVGTSSIAALGVNAARRRLIFHNPNATALVAFCPAANGATSLPLAAAVNGAGSITLLPGEKFVVDKPPEPSSPISTGWNAIASAGGSSLTILEFE